MPDTRKTSARKTPKKAPAKKAPAKKVAQELLPDDLFPVNHRPTDSRLDQEPLPTPPWREWNVPPFEFRTQHDFYAPPPDSKEYAEFQRYVGRYRNHPDFWKAMAELRVPSAKTLNWQSSREFHSGSDPLWNSLIEAYPEPVEAPEPAPRPEPETPRRFGVVHEVVRRVRSLV